MTFEADGRTFLGTPPEVAAVTLDALGVDALGINCSQGPAELRPLARRMLAVTEKPVIVQANAGLPHVEDGCTVFDIEPAAYAQAVAGMVEDGVGILGGCCGTDPRHVERIAELVRDHAPAPRTIEAALTVTSAQRLVSLPCDASRIAVIGERINPTGKRLLKEALRSGDYDYVVSQGIAQQEEGADILDVNVGLPDIDEVTAIQIAGERLSGAVTLPLQFDSTVPAALEAAVRRYAGKPIINSVNGKREVLDEILPIAARYGANVIGLTLDEEGIPTTAEGRFAIAERIVHAAAEHGIPATRILIDCLAMTASTDQRQAGETLRAIRMVKRRLGVKCTLGVSNISFGLPQRPLLNSTYLAAAFGAGLDAPILNPGSERYMDVVRSYRVLNGEDSGAAGYIERYATWRDPYTTGAPGAVPAPAAPDAGSTGASRSAAAGAPVADGARAAGSEKGTRGPSSGGTGQAGAAGPSRPGDDHGIEHFVLTGRKGEAARATRELLSTVDPSSSSTGTSSRPSTRSARVLTAARCSCRSSWLPPRRRGRASTSSRSTCPPSDGLSKGTICVATVKGDIHDIGKNIVKMLLDNYGYHVIDLGRDVDPHVVLKTVQERHIRLVGLSALMTTTVANMAQTIELLHREAPGTLVMVGGAVLTPEYAQQIGADFYAKDAAESARIAARVFG